MKPETTKAYLKKIPLLLLMYMVGGAFIRWYQIQNELLPDGSLVDGAFAHRVLLILPITFALGFGIVLYGLKNITTHGEGFSKHVLPLLTQILAGTLLIAGNVMQLLSDSVPVYAYTEVSVAMTEYLPYLGILAGICMVIFAVLTYVDKTPSPILYMLASVYLVVRLIVCFQEWNMDPSVHDYAYKLLAAITTMLGCFQIGGFSFGKGKRRITVFWCLCAAYFCAVSTADFFHGSFFQADPTGDFLNASSALLINISLLILTLTQGLVLLYAPDPVEDTPEADASTPDTSCADGSSAE